MNTYRTHTHTHPQTQTQTHRHSKINNDFLWVVVSKQSLKMYHEKEPGKIFAITCVHYNIKNPISIAFQCTECSLLLLSFLCVLMQKLRFYAFFFIFSLLSMAFCVQFFFLRLFVHIVLPFNGAGA